MCTSLTTPLWGISRPIDLPNWLTQCCTQLESLSNYHDVLFTIPKIIYKIQFDKINYTNFIKLYINYARAIQNYIFGLKKDLA